MTNRDDILEALGHLRLMLRPELHGMVDRAEQALERMERRAAIMSHIILDVSDHVEDEALSQSIEERWRLAGRLTKRPE